MSSPSPMPYFAEAWWLAALLTFAFGIAGAGLVAPFALDLPFAFLAAPLVGATFLPLTANAVYAIAGVSYQSSLIAAALVASVTLVLQIHRLDWRRGALQLAAAAVVVPLLTLLLCDARSALLGGPAIFFKYGTDQSGYAQAADWLLHFPVATRPVNDGGVWPYESFPEYLFNTDPRFGSFGLLSLIGVAARTDSLFAYPLATAVVIGSAALSCSALFTRSLPSLGLCFFSLLAGQWIDYGYTGFFGRIVGYPSVLVLAGFALMAFEGGRGRLAALTLIAGAAGTAYPGFNIGILAASILLPCLAMRYIFGDRAAFTAAIPALLIATVVPVLSSGTASRPVGIGQIFQGLSWRTVLPRVYDIEDRSLSVTGLTPHTVMVLTAVGLMLTVALIAVAVLRRRSDAFGFTIGPSAFVVALVMTDRVSSVQEFAGFPYPAFIVGGTLILENLRGIGRFSVLAALILAVAIRMPRLYHAVWAFGYAPDPSYILTLDEVHRLGQDMRGQTVELDLGNDVGRALWLMSEFGQLAGQAWWAPETWRAVLSYRPDWVYKAPPQTPKFRLSLDPSDDVRHHFKLEPLQR